MKPTARRLSTLAVLLILVAPTLLVLTPAGTASPYVPFTQGERVTWSNVTNLKTVLHFKASSPGFDPGNPQGGPQPSVLTMNTFPPAPPSGPGPSGTSTTYAVTPSAGAIPGVNGVATITSAPLTHEVNVSGSNAITVVWSGNGATNLLWTVTVRSPGGDTAGTAERVSAGDVCAFTRVGGEDGFETPEFRCTVAIALSKRTFTVRQGSQLAVDISATASGGVPGLPTGDGGTLATWQLRTGDYGRPSFLEVRSENAVRVATWAMNRDEDATRFFRPDGMPDRDRRTNMLTGFFAVKSAFGSADVCCVRDGGGVDFVREFPVETSILYRNNLSTYLVSKANLTKVELEYDATNSSLEAGMIVYKFPKTLWDINKWPQPNGEFRMLTKVRFRGDDPRQATELSDQWDFVVSSQSLDIQLYDDFDPTTNPEPLETSSHDMAAGSTTTFILRVRNLGTFGDNVTLSINQEAATPAFGWQALIGGEKVVGGSRLPLGPGETAVVTLTLTAPHAAQIGNSAIYTVIATSGVDPTTKSKPFSVVARVSDVVREDVGVLLVRDEESVRPGQDNLVKAYIWNRGTRPANLTMRLDQVVTPNWNATLLQGGEAVGAVTVSGIPAGALAPVTIRVRPEPQATVGTPFSVKVNATLAGSGETGPGMERTLDFVLSSISRFRLEVLRGINSEFHHLEMWCQSTDPSPISQCVSNPIEGGDYYNDSVAGTWYRVWVTNVGDIPDIYDLALKNVFAAQPPNAPPTAFPTSVGDRLQIGVRAPNGQFSPRSTLELNPGQTGELYVWVGHDVDAGSFSEAEFSVDVAATSRTTRTELRQTLRAVGEDADNGGASTRRNAVKLEHTERLGPYFDGNVASPLVDVSNAKRGFARKFVDLSGAPQFFYVRVTNGASWKPWVDIGNEGNPNDDVKHSSNVTLQFTGVEQARLAGWNISMRPRTGETDEKKNPWREAYVFSNENTARQRFESFRDQEFEIQVRAPVNTTRRIVAGESVSFSLAGIQSGGGSSFHTYLDFIAEVSQLANVTARAAVDTEFVRPGQQTAFVLYVANNGSVAAPVAVRTRVMEETRNAAQWSVTQQNINLSARENRTIAIIVGAPGDAAQDEQAVINVSLTFPKFPNDPNSENATAWVDLTAVVKADSKLRLAALPTAVQAAPGGVAVFQLELENLEDRRVTYEVSVPPILNWTESVPDRGTVEGASTTSFAYILNVPTDVLRDRSYQSVVKVSEVGNEGNFDLAVVTVNIVGGQPFPLVQAVKTSDLVERGGTVRFPMGVKNLGNTAGTFPLQAQAFDGRWQAWAEDATGRVIQNVTVQPNELKQVFLVAKAPRSVPEGTEMAVTLTAFNPSFDRNSAATVKALIHDYGLDVELRPARVDVIAGEAAELTMRVTNLGNGNDTVNLTADLAGLREWSVEFATPSVTLAPGASSDVRVLVRTMDPTAPNPTLPTPRQYTLTLLGGSAGGLASGLPKNDSSPLVVTVLDYRAFDVDGDGFFELAVDQNKRKTDGFEIFREIFRDETQSQVVDNLSGKQDGKLSFLLDVPEDGSYDGIADIYFDPNDLFLYTIEFTPDVNGDATPDYLLDVDGDSIIDHAWDTATRTLWPVTTIYAFGGQKPQFLVDTNGDGEADRYYDPETGRVTKTIPLDEDGKIGIDTDGSGKVGKIYDVEDDSVTDVQVASFSTFAKEFWYFFVAFAAVLVIFGIVLARRRRAP